ncbi:hypothetical protein D9619_013382 [Psilocybe cf. subviscida]|uniref:Nephrocystin 3-like N-terminal domain-containing protein n=1 Tax=Psilocybe cf. subviscida TaxID=2480587 RepID=A0A8H5BS42_9AGAR|nr:hypothetical protein D9619_013382 [Psilocybe cf. subviscida]
MTQGITESFGRLQAAVAHSAFHNSGERYNPPRCHPDTRVAVMDGLERWRQRLGADALLPILWLTGAAGAGKSAIAQSWAESCHERGFLLAGFFFGRSDPLRNVATYLVATVVYQIYALVPAGAQARILSAIEKDPLIFKRSIVTQLVVLLVEPLLDLFKDDFFATANAPNVIILDGLDECLDTSMQIHILEAITKVLQSFNPPFVFLIASRPEQDIRAFFSAGHVDSLVSRIVLSHEHNPDRDITTFLLHEFRECSKSHPFRHLLPSSWPSTEAISQLIEKSSGQFIFASTVVKYVKSPRRNPAHSLDAILDLRLTSGTSPFAELDALYTHILSRVEDIETVLQVLNFVLPKPSWGLDSWTLSELENLFGVETGAMAILFCDLNSLMTVEGPHHGFSYLTIMHASLADFLHNSSRSGFFFLHTQKTIEYNCFICLNFLRKANRRSYHEIMEKSLRDLKEKLQDIHSIQTPILTNALMSFSIPALLMPRWHKLPGIPLKYHADLDARTEDTGRLHADEDWLDNIYGGSFLIQFVTIFLEFIHHRVECEVMRDVTQHISLTMDKFWRQMTITLHGMGIEVDFRLSLLTLSKGTCAILQWPVNWNDLVEYNWTKDVYNRRQRTDSSPDESRFYFLLNQCLYNDLKKWYSAYLSNPYQRSLALEREIFARGAQYCLEQLCIYAPETVVPHIITRCFRLRRINLPWKWHNRVIKEYIGDHKESPWMWLQFQGPTPDTFNSLCTQETFRNVPGVPKGKQEGALGYDRLCQTLEWK